MSLAMFRPLRLLQVAAVVLLLFFQTIPSSCKPKHPEFLASLKALFEAALKQNPDLNIPGLELPNSASAEEKAGALAVHLAALPASELKAWLQEHREELEEIEQAMRVPDKPLSYRRIRHALEKMVEKIKRKLRNKELCKDVKKRGITPEVRFDHAPLRVFGYPVFSETLYRTVVQRRLSLNRINNINIPITVGAEDYVIQGNPPRIIEFLECFEDYQVVGQTLFPKGTWSSERTDGLEPNALYLQVQGAMKTGTVNEILVREALGKVVRYIDIFVTRGHTLTSLVEEAIAGDQTLWEYLENKGKNSSVRGIGPWARKKGDQFFDFMKSIVTAGSNKERMEVIYNALHDPQPSPDDWTQPWVVKDHSRVTLTLTTYPRVDSTVRSTKKLSGSVVSMREIADAFKEINWLYL